MATTAEPALAALNKDASRFYVAQMQRQERFRATVTQELGSGRTNFSAAEFDQLARHAGLTFSEACHQLEKL
ncbi:MAG: hypothetical protein ACRDQ5_02060 [Sciscionella sp.]